MLRVTDMNVRKWRTLEDSNLWPLPSEGSNRALVRLPFRFYHCFRSRLSGLDAVEAVTRNSLPWGGVWRACHHTHSQQTCGRRWME